MTIKEIKKDLKTNEAAYQKVVLKFQDDINSAFEDVITNPTQKTISDYKKKETVLATAFLAYSSKFFSKKIQESAQNGINTAKQLLKEADKTQKINPVDDAVYNDAVKYRNESIVANLQKVTTNIQANSNKVISDIKNNIDSLSADGQKVIATDIIKQFKDNGITSFKDAGGKTWTVERYAKMLVFNESIKATRQAMFTRFVEYGQDLVRVKHLGISPSCEMCAVWNEKILSLTGKDPNYPSLATAESGGLHHANCDHIEYQLPPDDFNEGQAIENPEVDGIMVKGIYSSEDIPKLKEIKTKLESSGYNPTGHAVKRIFERTTPEKVLDVLKNGETYLDDQKNKTYLKDWVSVHISKNTGMIKTIIDRENKIIPKTWKKL